MASIQKRPEGTWRARYRDPAGKEHSRHFGRKTDAQRWLDEVTTSLVTGRYVDPNAGKVTFEQWWEEWTSRQVWAAGTVVSAQQAADSVPFKATPMKAIRKAHVQAWVKAQSSPGEGKKGLAPSTMKVRYNYVRMAFLAAIEDRVVAIDPTAGVKLPRQKKAEARMHLPSVEDVRAALEVAPAHFRAFIAVCAFGGLRLGEAAGLQVADVGFLRRTIKVQRQVQGTHRAALTVVSPKNESERDLFIPQDLADLLAAHINQFGVRGEEAWMLTNGPDLWNRNSAGNAWRTTRTSAGIDSQFTLHDLRHFYASALIADGCDVVTVQRALGHSKPSITLDVYSHLWESAEDKTRSAAQGLMEAVLGPAADSGRTTG